MAGGKETPRQKMIGMMYLVLTALLALNVSKEIINAFVKLDTKLLEGNAILLQRSEAIMDQLAAQKLMPGNKAIVEPWEKKAQQVRDMAYKMDKFILIDCKNSMLKELEGQDFVTEDAKNKKFVTKDMMEVQTKDDYDIATRRFGGEQGSDGFAAGQKIREEVHKYRDQLLEFVTEYEFAGKKFKFNAKNVKSTPYGVDTASLKKELETNVHPEDRDKVRTIYTQLTLPELIKDHEVEVPWQLGTFDHAPVVAAAAIFTSISNDIRSAEAGALEIIASRLKVETFKFNKIDAIAMMRTGYLNMGDSMRVNVKLAAYDSSERTVIKYAVNDSNPANYKVINDYITVNATSPGVYKLYGEIKYTERGQEKWKPWQAYYEVGEPTGVIANEDFLVIYADYEHTFSASASGYPSDRATLNLPGVSVSSKGGGKYGVKAPRTLIGKKVQASISVKTDGGGSKSLAGPTFVVKQLPKPSSYLGSIPSTEANVAKTDLKANANAGVRVAYDPSVPLDPTKVKFSVTTFTMVVMVKGTPIRKTANGGSLTPEMLGLINGLSSGMSVSFTGIECVGPGGTKMKVPPLAFIVK